jgi:hypothetical protein
MFRLFWDKVVVGSNGEDFFKRENPATTTKSPGLSTGYFFISMTINTLHSEPIDQQYVDS